MKAKSTTISFIIFIVSIAAALFYTAVYKCYCSYSKNSFLDVDKYEKLKLIGAVEKFEKEMAGLAKQEGEAHVEQYINEGKRDKKEILKVIKDAPKKLLETTMPQRPESGPVVDIKQPFLNVDKYENLKLKAAVEKFQTVMTGRAKQQGEAHVKKYLDEGKRDEKEIHVVIEEAPEKLMETQCPPLPESGPVAENSRNEQAVEAGNL